eukprot:CAMPEP_0181358722 /NCGR_PEP_ID=MMETSP1106-20121128/5676_1 /TAXON_ID=81844 /ORGANISM="Mantoniella antarctica, Strain SL-175" /LENGTH=439 /DNA_ID=CAMNT_0023471731 /DNA_START=431 /DNA_END=1750 /DNA_ORIENTATION=+
MESFAVSVSWSPRITTITKNMTPSSPPRRRASPIAAPRRAPSLNKQSSSPNSSLSSSSSMSVQRASCSSAAAADNSDPDGARPHVRGGAKSGEKNGGDSGGVRRVVNESEDSSTSSTSSIGIDHDDSATAGAHDRVSADSWHRLETQWEAEEEAAMEGDLLHLLSPTWRILLLSDGSVTRHLRLLCPELRETRLECLRQGPIATPASPSPSPSPSPSSPNAAAAAATTAAAASANPSAARGIGLPDDCKLISGPMVQREVLLRISRGKGGGGTNVGNGDGDAEVSRGDGDSDDDRDRSGNRSNGGFSLDNECQISTTQPISSSGGHDDDVPMVYAASWWSKETFDKYMTDGANPMWTNLRSQHVELYREIRKVYMGDNAELEVIFGRKGPFWGRHYIFWHQNRPMTVVYEVFNPMLEAQLGPAQPPDRKSRSDLLHPKP